MVLRRKTAEDGTGFRPRRAVCRAALAALVLCAPAPGAEAETLYDFHHERVLGTSLELMVVAASEEAAKAAEQQVLAEIERLNGILGTYRGDTEINRLMAAEGPQKCSKELIDVLEACQAWQRRTGGAFNAQLGHVITLWKQAERAGKLPDDRHLGDAVAAAQKPACRIDRGKGTVTWLEGAKVNLDAMAKGYIVDKAVEAAAAGVPQVRALLLNIGGDIRVWNRDPKQPARRWPVRVADPSNSAANAPGISDTDLAEGAVATSGSYARFWEVDGKKYSHVLDGRTGRPVTRVVSATILAPDCATADALATTCMVLPPEDAARLVQSVAGAECLLVNADGTRLGTGRWQRIAAAAAPAAGTWPKGYRLTVSLTLTQTRERPTGAIWVEDAAGKPVRTLSVWTKKSKYLDKLPKWYAFGGKDFSAVRSVTRATPRPGTHEVVWDGTDGSDKPLAPGTYRVRIELHERKDLRNRYIDLSAPIVCGPQPAEVKLADHGYAKDIRVAYGPS